MKLTIYQTVLLVSLCSACRTCDKDSAKCKPLEIDTPRWRKNGAEVPSRSYRCDVGAGCNVDLQETIEEAVKDVNLTNKNYSLIQLSYHFICSNNQDKFGIKPASQKSVEYILTLRFQNCNITWTDVSEVGLKFFLNKVEFIHSSPLIIPESSNETAIQNGLENLSYVLISFKNFSKTESVDLTDFLPMTSTRMPHVGVLRIQCKNDSYGETVFCPKGYVTFNASQIRFLFPHLQILALSGVYPTENENLTFPWYHEPMKLPLNLSHSGFHLSHSTTAGYQANNVTNQFLRVLSINRLAGTNITQLCPYKNKLHTLLFYYSNIKEIPADCFTPDNETNLQYLDLSRNDITFLHNGTFSGLKVLETLHLSKCKLMHLQKNLFDDLNKLKILDLSSNNITELETGIFSKLLSLKFLFIHHNQITNIADESLPTFSNKLTFVDLRVNQLENIPNDCLTLPYLFSCNCDNNSITTESFNKSFLHFDPVRMLFVQYTSYHGGSFDHSDVGLKHEAAQSQISLRNNNITFIEFDQQWNASTKRALATFLSFYEVVLETQKVEHGYCGCSYYHLKKFILKGEAKNLILRSLYYHAGPLSVINFQTWKCSPHAVLETDLLAMSFLNVSDELFVCRNDTICPPGCECFRRPATDDGVIVDCANKNLTELPGNFSHSMETQFAIVDLKNNSIKSLGDYRSKDYDWLKRVKHLNLDKNKGLTYNNSEDMLRFLNRLENVTHLFLEDTQMDYLPEEIKKKNYTNLTISSNSLKCDCNTYWLKQWLQTDKSVLNAEDVYCASKTFPIVQMEKKDFVCEVAAWEVAISLCSLIVVMVAVTTCCYVYRMQLKIILFEKFGWHPLDRQPRDADKEYDAFIMYHRQDDLWAETTLCVGLERFGYRLCIEARDFTPGALRAEELTSSLAKSQRVIVVVSQHFLNASQEMSDFYLAHELFSKHKRRRYLIMIKLRENLNFHNYDVIKGYFSTGCYISVRWARFWATVRYWLPAVKRLPASTDNMAEEEGDTSPTTRI